MDKFPLLPTPLETQWMRQAINIPTITPTLSLKYLHKLILHNITEIKHITHPNGTHLMMNEEFKHYYNSPTKIEKLALNQARTLFCKTPCHSQCPNICLTHTTPNTLKNEYHIQNHSMYTQGRVSTICTPQPHHHQNTQNHPYTSWRTPQTSQSTLYLTTAQVHTKINTKSQKNHNLLMPMVPPRWSNL